MPLGSDFTLPYSAGEAWFYDAFIAAAVAKLVPAISERWVGGLAAGASVLDVGCGGGQNLLIVAERRPDLVLTGLDLNAGQVARARRRAAKSHASMRVIEGSAMELPFGDGQFDSVMSVASIKHWPDPARGLAECARVLAPGGMMFVAEADRGCYLDDARRFVAGMRIPRAMRGLALMGFRTYVAGQGLDLDDARELLASLPLAEPLVERVAGTPAVALSGRKPR